MYKLSIEFKFIITEIFANNRIEIFYENLNKENPDIFSRHFWSLYIR